MRVSGVLLARRVGALIAIRALPDLSGLYLTQDLFGGRLCASSGHSSSITSRISSEIMPMCSTSSMYL